MVSWDWLDGKNGGEGEKRKGDRCTRDCKRREEGRGEMAAGAGEGQQGGMAAEDRGGEQGGRVLNPFALEERGGKGGIGGK